MGLQTKIKHARRLRRKLSIRKKVFGGPGRPRLTVFRSVNHIYAQVVDDVAGRTLCAAGTTDGEVKPALKGSGNCAAAAKVGEVLALRAKAAGVTAVVFDRNGFIYHGRVKALADAARKAGLKF